MRHLHTLLYLLILALTGCSSPGSWSQRFREKPDIRLGYTYQVRVTAPNVLVAGPSVLRVFDRLTGAPRWDIGLPGGHFDADPAGNVYAFQNGALVGLGQDGKTRWAYPLAKETTVRKIILSNGQVYALANDSLLRIDATNGQPAAPPVHMPGLPPLIFKSLNFYAIEGATLAGDYWLSWSRDSLWQHRIADGSLVRDTFCGPRICDVALIDSHIVMAIPYAPPFSCPIDPASPQTLGWLLKGIIRMDIDPNEPKDWYGFSSSTAYRMQAPADLTWSTLLSRDFYTNNRLAVKPVVAEGEVYLGSRGTSQLIVLDKKTGDLVRYIELDGMLESSLAVYDRHLYYVADGVLYAQQR